LSQWAKKEGVEVYVQKLSGPEAKALKEQALATGNGPDIFILMTDSMPTV
jgi:maltose-binding protein MalE